MNNYHYTGFWLYFRLISAMIGFLVGASAAISFAMVFSNVHCAIWAAVSSILALIVFILHIAVRRDVTFSFSRQKFLFLMITGIFFGVVGFSVVIGFLIKGILIHETGVKIHGSFIVTVWGFMTWKWGYLMFYYARNYQNALNNVSTEILSSNSID